MLHLPEAGIWHERAAKQAWQRGRYDECAKRWTKALALRPPDHKQAAGWEQLASACLRVGRLREVADALASGFAADPSPLVHGRLLVTDAARKYGAGIPARSLGLRARVCVKRH